MARKALGRGLDALLPQKAPSDVDTSLQEVDIDRIRPNSRQPREYFNNEALDRMAASLTERGMLQPLLVRRAGDGFELIAGERRWRAAQRAGWHRVPVVVREANHDEALELALIENLQREDLNPIEEAQAYEMLSRETGLTQEAVAERVGRERSTVANYLRLLRLPERVQQLLVEGALSMGHARALLGLEDAAAQTQLAETAVAGGWSVRQTEAKVRAERSGRTTPGAKKEKDPDTLAAEEKMTRALGTPVRILGGERGRIEIRFASMEELDRLYELLISTKTRSGK